LQTGKYKKQIDMNLGARINQITNTNLKSFKFLFPSLPEQTKIANFLSSIDEQIETSQKELEKSKEWKKGLLQKMFV